jgi:hypothetical protein
MSESFMNDLAEQLRSAQTTPAASEAPQPEKVETPVAETAEPQPVQPEAPVAEAPKAEAPETPTAEKQWWEEDTTSVTSTTTNAPVAETKTEEKPQFELDDDLKLVLEYKKSGKTLADFVKEYKVEDYSTWSEDKLVEEGLKEFMNLSEDEMEQAKMEWDSASIFQKKQWAESFKQKFEEKNNSKLKELTQSNSQAEEYQKAVSAKYNAELDSFSQEVVGKELYGLKITDEMSKDLKNFIDKEFTLQNEDGSFDIAKMYSIGLWLKYGKDLVKANITKAKNEGREQVIKEVTNPSKNMTGGSSVVGSGLEAAQDAFNSLFQA